ncbi:hypothetical protein ABMA27_015638 [Loxostege sticticalis]|uniref:Rap1 GTPase-GDP dissociation stimulator 1-B n=1 Tax=Loxostege sticticalis TaxID=481309 RepID=A0ABR3I8C5_LOXSC
MSLNMKNVLIIGSSAKKSTSLETLVIQNISNLNDLKAKLNDIIQAGKDYEYDVSSCLKNLLSHTDADIVVLSVQAISELVKCEDKRETYAQKEIIEPIINILDKELHSGNSELLKQCCRALGNLCCNCDAARTVILEFNGVPVLVKLLEQTLGKSDANNDEIKLLASKTLLNFAIGGSEYSEAIVQGGLIDVLHKTLLLELDKDEMCDDLVSTCLLILSVINENTPEFLFEEKVNKAVLNVLKETDNVEISDLCLDHLHLQAEHDSVKTMLAVEGGVQLVCTRVEALMRRRDAGDLSAEGAEADAVLKQACDLIIIVLTGDDYCAQMMQDHIFDKLLDIFEVYNAFGLRMLKEPERARPVEPATVSKVQHAVLAALRNLIVPVPNKRVAAAKGRAAPLLLSALPHVDDHHVAYKLLAAIRMLVDGQESVARQLATNREALSAVARWGHAGEHAGAAGEAPRLLAWAGKQLRHSDHWRHIVEVEGCISSLVNMLIVCHSVMQNEAILALTLLAIESLNKKSPSNESPSDFDYEKSFISQLIKSEIGKHVAVLIETNNAKMPKEVAENLLAFLDITSKNNKLAFDYKEAKVNESLKKFCESRKDFSDDLKACINGVVASISDNGKAE